MSDDAFQCPRRGEAFSASFRLPSDDKWHIRDGNKTCSYCGSLHPDAFLGVVEAGAEITPTDKNYKAYVKLTHPEAGQPCILSSANFPQTGEGWVQITAENRDSLPLSEWHRKNWENGHWVRIEPRPAIHDAKFYFQHLSPEQQNRFIELYNGKKMKLGYPGYFYTRPFFCAPAKDSAA